MQNQIVNSSTRRKLWMIAIIVLEIITIIMLTIAISGELNKTPNPTAHTTVAAPSRKEIELAARVNETRIALEGDGRGDFAAKCLAKLDPTFTYVAGISGVEKAALVGIAAYESAGCTEPKGDEANVMHITLVNPRHTTAAALMLGKTVNGLQWDTDRTDNIALGATVLKEYTARAGSMEMGLSAYRHGPNKATYGDTYTVTVLAHINIARSLILAQETLAQR